jgi:hypothetical protein
MKRWKSVLPVLLGAALALPVFAVAQQESLGDLARQLREQREKSGEKPAKVYTNDNLPARPAQEGLTAASGMSGEPAGESQAAPPEAEGTTTGPAAESSGAESSSAGEQGTIQPETSAKEMHTEAYWQARFKEARARLAKAREEQQLVEDELNLLQIQEARELDPNAKEDLAPKIEAKNAEVEEKRAATAKAEQALQDLEKEFKESGAPEEWSKTEEQPNP